VLWKTVDKAFRCGDKLAPIEEGISISASRAGPNWYKKMDNMRESKVPQQQNGDALFNPVTQNT
jgi:hypothetical protein